MKRHSWFDNKKKLLKSRLRERSLWRLPRETKREKPWKREKSMGDEAERGKEMKRWRDEERGKHGRRRKGDREFATYLEMNERNRRRRRCTVVGHRLRLSTPLPLEVGFRWVFLPICVCQSFQSRLGFQGLLRVFFFLISAHGHISSHKAYVFFLERKRRDQSAPQSRLTRKSVRLSGVAFYFLRLKAFTPHLALRRASRRTWEAPFKTLLSIIVIIKWRTINLALVEVMTMMMMPKDSLRCSFSYFIFYSAF